MIVLFYILLVLLTPANFSLLWLFIAVIMQTISYAVIMDERAYWRDYAKDLNDDIKYNWKDKDE